MGLTEEMYLAKKEGKQIPYAYGVSAGYIVASPGDTTGPYGWEEYVTGMEGVYIFFPDTCEIGVFASSASEWTGGNIKNLEVLANFKMMLATSLGLESARYIGPNTPGNASPEKFQGPSSTIQEEIIIGGDAYVSKPNSDGGFWVGGKLDFGPGLGGAFSDWTLSLVGKVRVPDCVCSGLIYGLPGL